MLCYIATAPPKYDVISNDRENIPPPTQQIRQLSASPQLHKATANMYPVLSELQQKLSTVNQPNSPSTSAQPTPATSPIVPKTVSCTNQKVSMKIGMHTFYILSGFKGTA